MTDEVNNDMYREDCWRWFGNSRAIDTLATVDSSLVTPGEHFIHTDIRSITNHVTTTSNIIYSTVALALPISIIASRVV